MIENLLAGLVSGLFVTIFVVLFSRFWNAVIIPWFEERIYKDVKIEGKWYSLYSEGMSHRQEVISLKRHGHQVFGQIICVNGPDEGEEYSIEGSFRNLILPLIYENTDKSNTDRGTITLKSNGSGKRFSGKVSFYSTRKETIEDSEVFWFREKKDLETTLKKMRLRSEMLTKLSARTDDINEERLAMQKEILARNEESDVDLNSDSSLPPS